MSLTLGEKLRQAREARGMTINDVAEQTRISVHYIECMEKDDYSCLPGGVFNKGFVKLYARCVGIDEQEALQDYTRLMSQQNKVEEEPKLYRPSEVFVDNNQTQSRLLTIIIGVVAFGLLIWGGIVLVGYFQSGESLEKTPEQHSSQEKLNVQNPSELKEKLDEIKLELKVSAPKVWIEAIADGQKTMKEITSEKAETYIAKESLRIRYYKGFANAVELTLNGKPIKPPQPPQNRNIVDFEINKQNLPQILQSGQITIDEPKKTK
ncbi:MAG: helix-turn-helix domain-containing protein [Acidobacteria bacterium]|jgi:cytoskeletal protein RodZ|nr:MAG: helix-turn-helix domain-containing protein [Acidobacteriota bacterium]GIU81798.1 MAG: XRE family transcriptional regulator [Pyrinomonadaceae bacterium]